MQLVLGPTLPGNSAECLDHFEGLILWDAYVRLLVLPESLSLSHSLLICRSEIVFNSSQSLNSLLRHNLFA